MIRDKLKRAPTKAITPPGFPGEITVRGLMLSEVMAQQDGSLDMFQMLANVTADDDGEPVGTAAEWDHWSLEYAEAVPVICDTIKELTPGIEQAKKD